MKLLKSTGIRLSLMQSGLLLLTMSDVYASSNLAPIVTVGPNQTVAAGSIVKLEGAASDPEGKALRYLWSQPAGNFPKVDISNKRQPQAFFKAPVSDTKKLLKLIFAVRDSEGAKNHRVVLITVEPTQKPPPSNEQPLTFINDTGMTSCGDYARGYSGISNNDVVCGLLTDAHNDPVPAGQDGSTGRDINANSNDGHKGFSFVKIDMTGNELPANAIEWSCVKDQVTGLVWQSKTSMHGLHYMNDRYTWYEDNPRLGNGGLPGFQRASEYNINLADATCHGYSPNDPKSYCNTKAYVQRVNRAQLCRAQNWRLPTREELHSLVSYDLNPKIDPAYFPNTLAGYYWTSVPYAYLNKSVWSINFQHGGGSPWQKHNTHAVRLVHD